MLPKDDKNFQAIILAALLHDIGKFMQRAEIPLSPQSKNMENIICPVYQGRYSHQHVLWTNEFFEKYFIKKYPQFSYLDNQKDNVANLASYHHRPETPLQVIIQEADHLSSGMDRLEKDLEDETIGKILYKKTRLHSIFEKIDLGNNFNKKDIYRYELKPMIPTKENLFPKIKQKLIPSEGELLTDNYINLWRKFLREFKNLPTVNFDLFLQSLICLLEKYTWCIPSSTMDLPDISLFDHLKTTAAIAICLFKFHNQTNNLNEISIKNKELYKFLLIGGDLSGIQRYIFNFSHANTKGVSKLLRARSFYIGALSNISTHYLLQEMDLPLACNVMDAGGRFILLVPNTKSIKEKLECTYRKISNWFSKNFAGELVLNLIWNLEISGDDFKINKFPAILLKLQEKIVEKKYHKLNEILTKDGKWIEKNFILEELYKYDKGVCQSCGEKPATVSVIEEGKERRLLCRQCSIQGDIGKWLTKKKILAYSQEKPSVKENIPFFNNNYYLSFWSETDKLNPKNFYLIEKLYSSNKLKVNYGTKYLANYVPLWNSEDEFEELCDLCDDKNVCELKGKINASKTFQCIALKSVDKQNKTGSIMLGLLKADVDKLGFIFTVGLDRRLSISRYSTLSRELNLFFTGYVNDLLCREYQNIYTVYAGGDDLFLIGDWQTMMKFSKSLYDDFRSFTCNNPDITLSAGLVTIKPRFPIRRAADMVEECLEFSKYKGRNRATLFNTTIKWNEFDELLNFAEFLDRKLNNEDSGITRSFIFRLLRNHQNYLLFVEENKIDGLKFHSQVAYDVGRNVIKKDKVGKIVNSEEIKELGDKLYDFKRIDKNFLKNLKIPLFLVLYKNRKI